MASIFKSGKFWRAQVRKTGYPQQSATFDTKREAIEWASQVEARIETQSPEQVYRQLEANTLTLKQAFERYTKEVVPRKAPNSAKNQRLLIGWWTTSIWQTVPLAALSPVQVTHAIQAMGKEGKLNNTVRLMLATLSHLFTVARKEWGYTTLNNPVELVHKPKPGEGRDRRLVGNEEERLLAACTKKNPELADIVSLAIETAMRQGEIVAMLWSWVSFTDKTIKLPALATKTK